MDLGNLDNLVKASSGGKLSAEEVVSNFRDRVVKQTSTDIVKKYENPYQAKIYEQMRNNIAVNKDYWKKSGAKRRHVASIPPEIYFKAVQMYGKEVFKDRQAFKELFAKDDLGQMFLLVPPSSL